MQTLPEMVETYRSNCAHDSRRRSRGSACRRSGSRAACRGRSVPLREGGSAESCAKYQRSPIMAPRDRAGDPPGRRGAAGDVGPPSHRWRQGFPTPPAVRPRDRRRLPKAFGRRPASLAVPAPPRPALPNLKAWAEILGKSSLGIIIGDLWYYTSRRRSSLGGAAPIS